MDPTAAQEWAVQWHSNHDVVAILQNVKAAVSQIGMTEAACAAWCKDLLKPQDYHVQPGRFSTSIVPHAPLPCMHARARAAAITHVVSLVCVALLSLRIGWCLMPCTRARVCASRRKARGRGVKEQEEKASMTEAGRGEQRG